MKFDEVKKVSRKKVQVFFSSVNSLAEKIEFEKEKLFLTSFCAKLRKQSDKEVFKNLWEGNTVALEARDKKINEKGC
jgi:hypothetical protein